MSPSAFQFFLVLVVVGIAARAAAVELRLVLSAKEGVHRVEYREGDVTIVRPTEAAPAGVEIRISGRRMGTGSVSV